MSACLSPAQLAAIASRLDGEPAGDHVETCAACRRALDEQRAVRALVARMPDPVPPDRRRLAAEMMARADRLEVAPPRRWRVAVAVGGLALAAIAAAAVLLARRDEAPAPSEVRVPAPAPAPDSSRVVITPLPPDPAPEPPPAVVDPPPERPRLRVDGARTVIAGSAETSHPGPQQEDGFVWESPAARDALIAFEAGWTALRAGQHADAIAAFDRATHPAVAEDAAYWAAIAAERDGDAGDARRRLEAFLARFPASPRADAASAALTRLGD